MNWRLCLFCLLAVLPGCCAKRYYPLCFYGPPPPAIQSEADLKLKLTTFIGVTAGKEARMALAPNDRIVVINATRSQHSLIRQAWPMVGCIGPGDPASYGHFKACVDYLAVAVRSANGLPALGENSDGIGEQVTLFCGSSLHGIPLAQ